MFVLSIIFCKTGVIFIKKFTIICITIGLLFSMFGCASKTEISVETDKSDISENYVSSSIPIKPESSESNIPQSSNPSEISPAASNNKYFTDIMPPLTAEEENMINEPVPISMWGYEANGEPILDEYYEEIFRKPLKYVTFGEVWRFNNNENPYYVPCYLVDNGTYFTHTVCEIAAEMKSIKSVQIHAGGKINEEYDWSSLYEMQWLEELILRGDNMGAIKKVPIELGKLVNLSLFQLRNLKVLNLDSNPLENIPNEISTLDRLEELTIGFTNLGKFYVRTNSAYPISKMVSKLPDNIGKLDSLKRLEINNLPINKLPDSICDLTNLEKLSIRLPLKSLPDNLENLKTIENLSIIIMLDDLTEENGPLQKQVDEIIRKPSLG